MHSKQHVNRNKAVQNLCGDPQSQNGKADCLGRGVFPGAEGSFGPELGLADRLSPGRLGVT